MELNQELDEKQQTLTDSIEQGAEDRITNT